MKDEKLNRLLRSAAQAREDDSPEAPFGFETRVVALWRAGLAAHGNGLAGLVRRVALAAVAIIIVAGAATIYQSNQDFDEPYGNEYAIADSAIQSEF